MYPRLSVDLNKVKKNVNAVTDIAKKSGGMKTLMVVTKCVCAAPEFCDALLECEGVDYLADSRVQNVAKYAEKAHKAGKQTVLLRIPMHSEVEDVVKYVDLCFNSELSTIRLLNEEAGRQGKKQEILLMIDMGDLREGMFYQNEDIIYAAVEEILGMENIVLKGIGVNLTCYGAIIPKKDNLGGLVEMAGKIEAKFGIKLDMVSGGNSSSIYLIWKEGGLPEGINNLRLGESYLLGNDTAYGEFVPGTDRDVFTLEAQIVELKEKPSVPIGEVGKDAFGQVPYYEDRGVIKRAIIALGKQDSDLGGMIPLDPKVEILGGSSDHIILDVTQSDKEYAVGDILSFNVEYGALLKLCTSEYVEKVYVK